MYQCLYCQYITNIVNTLKKVYCSLCKNKEQNFNYICPKCNNIMFKRRYTNNDIKE